jgi:hypothetical protein
MGSPSRVYVNGDQIVAARLGAKSKPDATARVEPLGNLFATGRFSNMPRSLDRTLTSWGQLHEREFVG